MTIVLAYVLSGGVGNKVPVFVSIDNSETSVKVVELLNSLEGYSFYTLSPVELEDKIEGDPDVVGVLLNESTYTVFSGAETDTVRDISLSIEAAYNEFAFEQKVVEVGGDAKWKEVKRNLNSEEAFSMNVSAMNENQIRMFNLYWRIKEREYGIV